MLYGDRDGWCDSVLVIWGLKSGFLSNTLGDCGLIAAPTIVAKGVICRRQHFPLVNPPHSHDTGRFSSWLLGDDGLVNFLSSVMERLSKPPPCSSSMQQHSSPGRCWCGARPYR